MKGIRLLFAVMLIPLAFQAVADTSDTGGDTARAAVRRDNSTATVSLRQKSATQSVSTKKTSRASAQNVTSDKNVRSRATNIIPRNNNVISDSNRTSVNASEQKKISTRTTKPVVQSRTPVVKNQNTRTSATTSRSGTRIAQSPVSRTQNTRPTTSRSAMISRSATVGTHDITTRDFQSCRSVFYDCMDEFCANKDTTLKRCACSSRVNEFDSTKKQLEKIEDKLLDFSQRLLTVNMEREDAEALFTPTEGELAYSDNDRTKSKKMLDEIAKKLNNSFNDSNFDQNLNAINLSLDTDAAFDSIDSLMGASTTTKTGTALYSAARPVCREMAAEVCSESDLEIVESGYQMSIEQDCNTVSKSYATQMEQAQAKIKESGALLDMSRLDIHQKRNSDDVLTCKSKMLEMLTDSTVCGSDMQKCLDISGQYIDPTTGEAFLSANLSDLSKLIIRPETNKTWTNMPGNEKFVAFLDGKKKFLEPAMENCQDVSDYVWDSFVEDALAQIKLAQDKKLDDIRLSCTTLMTQCLSDAYDSIAEFDSRALSTFGVMADKTANAMCEEVKTACTALIDTIGDTDWSSGITEIAADKSFETILSACREVGQQCIIRTCKSAAGNFGLCTNVNTSINRKSIISYRACWDEVYDCVASAGDATINQIMTNLGYEESDKMVLYNKLYGDNIYFSWDDPNKDEGKSSVFNHCHDIGDESYKCALTEYLWGNCNDYNNDNINNNIITVDDKSQESLLSWFARNTGEKSCRDTTCQEGFRFYDGKCMDAKWFDSFGNMCEKGLFVVLDGESPVTNCCVSDTFIDMSGKEKTEGCCVDGVSGSFVIGDVPYGICLPDFEYKAYYILTAQDKGHLLCLSNATEPKVESDTLVCDGTFIWVEEMFGAPVLPTYSSVATDPQGQKVSVFYKNKQGAEIKDVVYPGSDFGTPVGVMIDYASYK